LVGSSSSSKNNINRARKSA